MKKETKNTEVTVSEYKKWINNILGCRLNIPKIRKRAICGAVSVDKHYDKNTIKKEKETK